MSAAAPDPVLEWLDDDPLFEERVRPPAKNPVSSYLYHDTISRVIKAAASELQIPAASLDAFEKEWRASLKDKLARVETWGPDKKTAEASAKEDAASKARLAITLSAAVKPEPVSAAAAGPKAEAKIYQNPASRSVAAVVPSVAALLLEDEDEDAGALTVTGPVSPHPSPASAPASTPWLRLDSPQHTGFLAPISSPAIGEGAVLFLPPPAVAKKPKKPPAPLSLRAEHIRAYRKKQERDKALKPEFDLLDLSDSACSPENTFDTVLDPRSMECAAGYVSAASVKNAKKTHDPAQGQTLLEYTDCVLVVDSFEIFATRLKLEALDHSA